MELVTIKYYITPAEAGAIKSLLEAEDIYCYMKDEHTVTTAPFMANLMKGIKLQVRPEDKERAEAVLKEAGYLKDEEPDTNNYAREGALFVILMIVLMVILYFWQGR